MQPFTEHHAFKWHNCSDDQLIGVLNI